MKRLAIVVTIAFLCAGFANATSIQIRPILGYGFGVGQQVAGTDTEVNAVGDTIKNENIYYSGGAGLNMGVGVLVGIEENFGIEIGLGYVLGLEKEVSKFSSPAIGDPYLPEPAFRAIAKMISSYIPIDLTARISTELGGLRPYAGFGPTFALGAVSKITAEAVAGADRAETETEVSYNTGIGWNATVGAESDLSETMTLFFGVSMRNVNLRTEKSEITKHTENGVDRLRAEFPNVMDRETEFRENVTDVDIARLTPDDPMLANTMVTPFNSLSINVGVAFRF